MLQQDPRLPLLRTAWSGRKMQEFLNQAFLPSLWPGQEAAGVSIQDMTYTPGRECVILYALEIDGHRMDDPMRLVVSFSKDDRLGDIYARYREQWAASPDRPWCGAVYLADHKCLLEFFPVDWRLPSLGPALERSEVGSLLSWNGQRDQPVDVRVLRYRPHKRCVLRYRWATEGPEGRQGVIGKVYPHGAKAAHTWRLLHALAASPPDGGAVFPRPVAFWGEGNLVLMEEVAGTNMKETLESAHSDEWGPEAIEKAARVLAVLHGFHGKSEEVRSAETELAQLRKRAARLHLVAPLLAERVGALLGRLETEAAHRAAPMPSFIHGDYKPSQLLMDGGRVAIVDFDRACLGDPAIDVGNFMAELHKEALATGQDYLRQMAEGFLGEYLDHGSHAGLAERARLFRSIALVRMALRRFQRSPHVYARTAPHSLPDLLLHEADLCLAAV